MDTQHNQTMSDLLYRTLAICMHTGTLTQSCGSLATYIKEHICQNISPMRRPHFLRHPAVSSQTRPQPFHDFPVCETKSRLESRIVLDLHG